MLVSQKTITEVKPAHANRRKEASDTKGARRDIEKTRKKREFILEAVCDAGFPPPP